ncbi:MAG: FMN-binding protein [Chloroflexi bacterium]|nr:FMN-binding protein [Chloroflexota bacterium]
MTESARVSTRATRQRERLLGVLALATIAVAWWIGVIRQSTDISGYLPKALPKATRFVGQANGIYAGYDSSNRLVGYVGVGDAAGYGGPMQVVVGINTAGNLVGVAVANHRETLAYLNDALASPFFHSLTRKTTSDPFTFSNDLDAVSGASYTARAIAEATRLASRKVGSAELGQTYPADELAHAQFGLPEIMVALLYLVGFVGHRSQFKFQKQARWFSLLAGLIVLGFLYNIPLSLANFNSVLLGFFPAWQTHIYWYLLLGGVILVFAIDNKNPYCEWFCPFGAMQECAGVIGRAKPWTPPKYRAALRWVPRGLAWLAIVIAMLSRNPGATSYEVFGMMFHLIGSNWQFMALVTVLVLATCIKRPWCNFLCPIRPVTDFIRMVRGGMVEVWQIGRTRIFR